MLVAQPFEYPLCRVAMLHRWPPTDCDEEAKDYQSY